jgi:hypothetical protein
VPRLDFVRGGIIDPQKFIADSTTTGPLRGRFEQALSELAEADRTAGALIAVFGTGYPVDPQTGDAVSTGFTGIENIHMNQGAFNRINSPRHYVENGPDQDGGLIFLLPDGPRGFFVKFSAQTVRTDDAGNPVITGIKELDDVPAAVRRAIMPPYPRRTIAARRTDTRTTVSSASRSRAASGAQPKPNKPATKNDEGYVFADFDPNDASGQYIPDNDAGTYKTPFVQQQSKGHTRGIVPAPHVYPRLALDSITGANPPGYRRDSGGQSIQFDVIGDSGAPSLQKLKGFESKVTDLMAHDAQVSPPAFLFHVGDVVYFYGEENYYYSQFYEPFRAYPAPIFAIPGNHDGIIYNDSMESLASFRNAFCAPNPGRWSGAGGILRSSMTQPGVYFTLDAPLVSIIGLYSNCGESFGWLDEQQLTFFYKELVRLKAQRQNGLPAVLLAIHHFPRWFPAQKPKDPTSAALDAACTKAGFWPDAVICGHAHLYQRVVRQDVGQDLPYVLSGAGGYAITPSEEVGKSYMAQIAGNTRLGFVRNETGYVRATVTSPAHGNPALRFEYRSVKPLGSGPDDICAVNLRTSKLI